MIQSAVSNSNLALWWCQWLLQILSYLYLKKPNFCYEIGRLPLYSKRCLLETIKFSVMAGLSLVSRMVVSLC